MPISDKVIEMETKKPGRTIMFIVFIAVLAAASVAFAVLWVVKAPAVDPPRVEKIVLDSTDMPLKETRGDAADPVSVYSVSVSCTYSIDFNVLLEEGVSVDQVTTFLTARTDPKDMLTDVKIAPFTEQNVPVVFADETVDASRIVRYTMTFKVASNAKENVRLYVESIADSTVYATMWLVVEDPYVEYFDLVKRENDETTSLLRVESGAAKQSYTLQKDTAKSTATEQYYTLENAASDPIIYYNEIKNDPRNGFLFLDFEQLGKKGLNGQYAKIKQDVHTDSTHYFDQVKVEIADKDGKFTEYTGNGSGTSAMQVYTSWDQKYCNSVLRLRPMQGTTVTVRLTANACNNATQKYYIYLELACVNSSDIDKISEIILNDPYNAGETTDDLYLYLGESFSTTKSFALSDYISVRRKGNVVEPENVTWGTGGLRVTSTDVNFLRVNQNTGALTAANGSAVGDTTITVRDSDPQSFSSPTVFNVHICAPVDKLTVKDKNSEYAQSVTTTTHAGDEEDMTVLYALASSGYTVYGSQSSAFTLDRFVSSAVTVQYPDKEKLPLPFDKDGKATDASQTIVIEGLQNNYTVDSKLTAVSNASGNNLQYTAGLKFTVGSKVKTGSYTFTLHIAPQGVGEQEKTVEVTLNVMTAVTSFELTASHLPSNTKTNAELVSGGDEYTLTLAVGTGTMYAGVGLSDFSLDSLLRYNDSEGEITDPTLRAINFKEVKLAAGSGNLGDILHVNKDGEQCFVIPDNYQADKSLTITLRGNSVKLTVRYRFAVTRVGLDPSQTTTKHTIEYSAPTDVKPVSLQNTALDKVKAYDSLDRPIANQAYMMHDELLNIDIALRAGGANGSVERYLLPKQKTSTGWLYYPVGTNVNDANLNTNSALFSVYAGNTLMTEYDVEMLKDLFAYSVQYKYDCQTIYVYYSYGNETIMYDKNDQNKVSTFDEDFTVCTQYNLVRRYDDFLIFEDDTYSTVRESLEYLEAKGTTIHIYYSGIIYLPQAFNTQYPYPSEIQFYNGDAQDPSKARGYIVEKYNVKDGEYNIACSAVTEIYNTDNAYLADMPSRRTGEFELTCGSGTFRNVLEVTYSENAKNGKSEKVSLGVSDSAVPIKSAKFYTTDPGTAATVNAGAQEFTSATLYRNASKNNTLTVYFRVEYDVYSSNDHNALVEFEIPQIEGLSITKTGIPAFKTIFENLKEGKITSPYICAGTVTVDATQSVNSQADKPYILMLRTKGGEDTTAQIHVTTALDEEFALVYNDGTQNGRTIYSDQKTGVGKQTLTLTYDETHKTHTFDFGFATKESYPVDTSKLTFAVSGMTFGTGTFVAGAQTLTGNNVKNATGYTFELNGNPYETPQTVTITVTEEGTDAEYKFVFDVVVAVPVEDLWLQIGNKTVKATDNAYYDFTTDGYSTDDIEVALKAVYNKDDKDRQPKDIKATFAIAAEEGKTSKYTLTDNENGTGKLAISHLTTSADIVTLVLEAGGQTVSVKLRLSTTLRTVRMDGEGAMTVNNNNTLYFTSKAYDIDGKAVTDSKATVVYSYTIASDSTETLQVVQNADGNGFTPNGNGTFTVKVTYSYTSATGTHTAQDSVTVTVRVPVGSIGAEKTNVTLVAGESDSTVKVNITAGAANTAFTAQSSQTDIASVALSADGKSVVITPKAVGDAEITLMCADDETVTATIAVHVIMPTLNIGIGAQTEYDVLSDSKVDVTAGIDGLNGLLNPTTEYSVTVDNAVVGGVTVLGGVVGNAVTLTNGKGALTFINIDKYTQAQFGVTYTLTVNGTVNGVALASKTVAFTLTYTYELDFDMTGYTTDKFEIDSAKYSQYKFRLKNTNGYIKNVAFSSDEMQFSAVTNNAAVLTEAPASVGPASVTASLTLFGEQMSVTKHDYRVVDSGKIASALYAYDSSITDYAVNTSGALVGKTSGGNTVALTQLGAELAIDYTNESNAKSILLVVDYSGAPTAVQNATENSFIVSDNSELKLVENSVKLVSGNGKHYYVAQYRALHVGTVDFGVQTAQLGGMVYAAGTVRVKLTATAPKFATAELKLDPGATGTLHIAIGSGTFASVSYSAKMVADNTFTVTDGNSVVVKAPNGEARTAVMAVTATVSGGAFDGMTYTFPAVVSVNSYAAPYVKANKTVFTVYDKDAEGRFDISGLASVVADAADTAYEGNLVMEIDGSQGMFVENRWTPSQSYAAGLTQEVTYTLTVTDGFYKGKTYSGSFDIIVMPQLTANDFTVKNSENTVIAYAAPGEELTLAFDVHGMEEGTYALQYAVSDAAAGTLIGNKFTASSSFGGSVNLSVSIVVTSGAYAGYTTEISKMITVTGLTLANGAALSVQAGNTLTLTANSFVSGSVAMNGGMIKQITVATADSDITAEGNVITVPKTANLGSTNRLVPITVTIEKSGITYIGNFTVTVQPVSGKLTLDLTLTEDTLNASNKTILMAVPSINYVTVSIANSQYEVTVLSGRDLVTYDVYTSRNTYKFTAVEGKKGGTVEVQVAMHVESPMYNGTITAVTSFTVEATATAPNPTASVVDLTDNGGKITVSLDGYTRKAVYYTVTEGATYISLDSQGNFTFINKGKTAVTNGIKVTAHVVIDGAPYTDEVYDAQVTITVPAAPALNLQVSANAETDRIDATVNSTYTYKVEKIELVGTNEYFTLSEDGNITYTKRNDTATPVTVTVKVTVSGAPYADTYEREVTVTVPAKSGSTNTVSNVRWNFTSVANLKGEITCSTANGVRVQSYSLSKPCKYINLLSDGTFTFNTLPETEQTVWLTIVYSKTTTGMFGSASTSVGSVETSITLDAFPEVTLGYTASENGMKREYSVTNENATATAYEVVSGTNATVDNSGNVTLKPGSTQATVTVRATVKINSGKYKDYVFYIDETITVDPAPSLTHKMIGNYIVLSVSPQATVSFECDTTYITVNTEVAGQLYSYAFTDETYKGYRLLDIIFTATVSTGMYEGKTLSKKVPVVTIPKLTATHKYDDTTERTGGEIIVEPSFTDGPTTIGAYSYATSNDCITVADDGTFTVNRVGMATVTVSAAYGNITLTTKVDVVVDAKPEITAVYDGANQINASWTSSANPEFQYFAPTQEYLTVDEKSGEITFNAAKAPTENKTVTVTVQARIESGRFVGQYAYGEAEVLVVGVPAPVVTANCTGMQITVTLNGDEITQYGIATTAGSQTNYNKYIESIDPENGTVKLKDNYISANDVEIELVVTVQTGDARSQYATKTANVTVTVPAKPVPVLTATYDETANKITYTLSGANEQNVTFTVQESDKQYLTVADDGTVTCAQNCTLSEEGEEGVIAVDIDVTVQTDDVRENCETVTDTVTLFVKVAQSTESVNEILAA